MVLIFYYYLSLHYLPLNWCVLEASLLDGVLLENHFHYFGVLGPVW